MSEFICPKTGEECEFAFYCSVKKEMVEDGTAADDPVMDLLIDRLPGQMLVALENAGFCAEERIQALGAASRLPKLDPSAEITEADVGFLAKNDRESF